MEICERCDNEMEPEEIHYCEICNKDMCGYCFDSHKHKDECKPPSEG